MFRKLHTSLDKIKCAELL